MPDGGYKNRRRKYNKKTIQNPPVREGKWPSSPDSYNPVGDSHLAISKFHIPSPEFPHKNGLTPLMIPYTALVLEAAVSGQCRYVVTFNIKDFAGADRFAVEPIRPKDFLVRIGELS